MQLAFLYTAAAAIIWGATAPIMKLTLTQVPVFSLAFIRMAIAALILGLFILKKAKIAPKDLPLFYASSLTGVFLNLTFFFLALQLTQAINASFLVAAVPIFTLIAAHFYLKEPFSSRLVFASVIALFGVIIIIGKPDNISGFASTLGNILIVVSTISWVFHEIIAKKLLKIYDSSTVAFYSMALGALNFFPVAAFEFWQNPTWPQHLTFSGLAGILYGIFFASLIAYWTWQKGLSKMSAGQASFFFYLDPISGTALSITLLGEKITPQLIFGAIFIVIGVILAEHKRHSHLLHR